MAATPASVARRLTQRVYVDVPPSPYAIAPSFSHQKTSITPQLISITLKENTSVLRPCNGGVPHASSDILAVKRKTPENELSSAKATNAKKQKTESVAHATQHANTAANTCPEFPNGFIFCHQCSRKRDVAASIHCTSVKNVKGVVKKCNIKLCDRCLKRRYGEDAEKIRSVGNDGAYAFVCPKCRDICTCWKCKKLKGPSSAGKPSVLEQSFFAPSPSKVTKRTVEVLITTSPSKGLYSPISYPTLKGSTSQTTKLKLSSVNTSTKTKSGTSSKQQTLHQMIPQSLPELKWTEIPTSLNLDDAKSRLEIREFILRFASVMEPVIPRTQLAELDDLGCDSDDNEMAPWVSDACVKSMILGLLGMLATLKGDIQKNIKSVVRDIRATGSNLNKIWLILARLQSTTDDGTQLSFPDPLPPPASVVVYNTRTTRRNGGPTISIGHTAQMIPVLVALIEAALMTPVVREELDNGLKEAKEVTREVQKAIREENDRWDAERKSFEPPKETSEGASKPTNKVQGEQIKIQRGLHKVRVRDLENALRLVAPVYAPRFAPLGIDKAGRVYWASSPDVLERKAALDFIASATVSKKGRTHVVNDSAPRKWSWFVAVWGRKTHTVGTDLKAVECDSERWWAFTDPLEIRKVADWIRIDAAIDLNSDADANKPLASLVKGLNEYAQLLDWRLKEDKYRSVVV